MDRAIEIFGFCVGLLYLYWEYNANPKLWIASLVMPLISFWVYFRAGLYADFAMNFYYFFMAIYGYFSWTRHKRSKGNTLSITHIRGKALMVAAMAFALCYSLIAAWLVGFTNSTVPWWDALTTALSIVATWMLARKFIEQWWAWIVVDAVSACLLVYKDRPFYAILYGLYTLVAVAGYLKWKRLMAPSGHGATPEG